MNYNKKFDFSQKLDPFALADRNSHYCGEIPLVQMTKLRELLTNDKGSIEFDLKFSRDGQNRCIVKGVLSATLPLICQRCCERMCFFLQQKVNLCVVTTDVNAKQIPKELDPFVMDEESLNLLNLIEDEVILSLPLSPRHKPNECSGVISDYFSK